MEQAYSRWYLFGDFSDYESEVQMAIARDDSGMRLESGTEENVQTVFWSWPTKAVGGLIGIPFFFFVNVFAFGGQVSPSPVWVALGRATLWSFSALVAVIPVYAIWLVYRAVLKSGWKLSIVLFFLLLVWGLCLVTTSPGETADSLGSIVGSGAVAVGGLMLVILVPLFLPLILRGALSRSEPTPSSDSSSAPPPGTQDDDTPGHLLKSTGKFVLRRLLVIVVAVIVLFVLGVFSLLVTGDPRSGLFEQTVKSDLNLLARMEAEWFEEHDEYTQDLTALGFFSSDGVTIRLEAVDGGWAATGTFHIRSRPLSLDIDCAIVGGAPSVASWGEIDMKTLSPGEVRCEGP